jgi:hypothetical protein
LVLLLQEERQDHSIDCPAQRWKYAPAVHAATPSAAEPAVSGGFVGTTVLLIADSHVKVDVLLYSSLPCITSDSHVKVDDAAYSLIVILALRQAKDFQLSPIIYKKYIDI